ncbi:metabolite traffic protein EboE [Flavilitoribacter nigricans]|uniref:Xylose isomerase n=1 Tax=Flavilitoribacter nigricans (strain ATCC 23147 / DSM 23189 / NBRC 102662 / NCIMB 1420 / SS-2) TaxID=1122177 RepID=A0A2D0N137_FLAN2|nr:metabolite traffic protein EboE [Flavilitoribacter nigricans]PHN02262.1 xylose isomerase [Flavilitoribacter nigricans DSM 23189 = NBRC 102662]
MKISSSSQLTYCTNIHPGEHWSDVWESLKEYTLPLKERIAPEQDFGIGLRLSNIASQEILEGDQLPAFKKWLAANGMYVFTMNAFPYGGFHRERVKDDVHTPDWSTTDRLEYTRRCFDILAYLLPEGMEGGISTSPVSYRYWFTGDPDKLAKTWEKGCIHMAEIASHLAKIKAEKGIQLHLDIEPEPDGLMENTQELIDFFQQRLIPIGGKYLQLKLGISEAEAAAMLYEHIQACYDVCHFAVVYEAPEDTFRAWAAAGIKVGKVQISAALKATFPERPEDRGPIVEAFEQLNESTYLHQVVARLRDGSHRSYNDLPDALPQILDPETAEWRTHFHVPIFIDTYDHLSATRDAIELVLNNHKDITQHWEVETYTWEVLPEEIRFGLVDSIERELRWVLSIL